MLGPSSLLLRLGNRNHCYQSPCQTFDDPAHPLDCVSVRVFPNISVHELVLIDVVFPNHVADRASTDLVRFSVLSFRTEQQPALSGTTKGVVSGRRSF